MVIMPIMYILYYTNDENKYYTFIYFPYVYSKMCIYNMYVLIKMIIKVKK